MIIDVHNHVGKTFSAAQTGEQLIANMDGSGVDKAVALPFFEYTDMISEMNDIVADNVRKFPDRLIGFFVVCPWHEERAIKEFDRCANELQLKGLKLHPEIHGYPLDLHSLIDPIFEKCVEHKMPILCHGQADSPFNVPAQFGEMADTFPDVTLIMAHMGFWTQLESAITQAKKHENLYLDTSMVPLELVRTAVEGVGAEKILMGSDTPDTVMELEVRKIELAVPNKKERELILGSNAARILRVS